MSQNKYIEVIFIRDILSYILIIRVILCEYMWLNMIDSLVCINRIYYIEVCYNDNRILIVRYVE